MSWLKMEILNFEWCLWYSYTISNMYILDLRTIFMIQYILLTTISSFIIKYDNVVLALLFYDTTPWSSESGGFCKKWQTSYSVHLYIQVMSGL